MEMMRIKNQDRDEDKGVGLRGREEAVFCCNPTSCFGQFLQIATALSLFSHK